MPRDGAIIFRDPVGKLDDGAQFRIESVRRTRRVLSSREFWRDRGTGAYTGSLVLMLLGEKDDNLPVTKIQNYLAYGTPQGLRSR
jgi:hypothetical protein